MARKSAAQIRRLQKRAEARGEVYVAPPPRRDHNNNSSSSSKRKDQNTATLHEIAKRLEQELKEIDDNPDLSSKARRSAKRKAEAVAAEDADMSRTELLERRNTTKLKLSKKDTVKDPVDDRKETTVFKNVDKDDDDDVVDSNSDNVVDSKPSLQLAVAKRLTKELEAIDKNKEMKAKDRRSAKRKASAIALEETGMEAEALLELCKKKRAE